MSVNIDEMNTEVALEGSGGAGQSGGGGAEGGELDEHKLKEMMRAEAMRRARTLARGFDD